jgi:MFS family permease
MTTRHTHPATFMVLILPFGVMSGYLTVALAWLLSQSGLSVGQVAALVALSFIPHTWKFAWAPIADTTLTRKAWYVIAAVVSSAGILAMGAIPADAARLPLLSVIVLVSNLAVTFLGMAVESLMAYGTMESEKGRAAGWFQAGNLGGAGLGGGAGLWLAQHLAAPWMAAAALALVCLLCCLALPFVPEPASAHGGGGLGRRMSEVARDLWALARSRVGYLALVLCFLPLGSGAAAGLWSAVAKDWDASAATVALVTGLLAGLVSAAGCIVGGWLCDRMDRKTAYAVYGVLQALCAIAMALAPRTEGSYILFTSIYAFITGLTYAGFSAFVLEAMGTGAAATKYSVYASLANTPIQYMTLVDGWGYGRWGPSGMLLTEAAFGALGLLLFVGFAFASRRPGRLAPAVGPAPAEL